MGVPSKSQPQVGQKVHSYGHDFRWTPLHKNAEELNALVYTYDKLATDALDRLNEITPSGPNPHGRDWFKLVQDHASEGGVIGELWDQLNTVPDWVDWEQIERGQKVLWRYIAPSLVAVS
jgi:hypothetical protein